MRAPNFGVRELALALGKTACCRRDQRCPEFTTTIAVTAGASSLDQSGSKLPHSKVGLYADTLSLLPPIARRLRPCLPKALLAIARPQALPRVRGAPAGTAAGR